jgi:hypothetical protein
MVANASHARLKHETPVQPEVRRLLDRTNSVDEHQPYRTRPQSARSRQRRDGSVPSTVAQCNTSDRCGLAPTEAGSGFTGGRTFQPPHARPPIALHTQADAYESHVPPHPSQSFVWRPLWSHTLRDPSGQTRIDALPCYRRLPRPPAIAIARPRPPTHILTLP